MKKPNPSSRRLVLQRQSIRVLTEQEVAGVGGAMCNTVTCTKPPPCCDSNTELLNPFTN